MLLTTPLTAGVRVEFAEEADFFRLMSDTYGTTFDVQFLWRGTVIGEADGVRAGFWEKFQLGQRFDRVAITAAVDTVLSFATRLGSVVGYDAVPAGPVVSMAIPTVTMQAGLNPVVAGGTNPGWVSGGIASLAASAASSTLFDLGPNWSRYTMAAIVVFPAVPSSGLSSVSMFGSETPVINFARRLKDAMSPSFSTIFSNIVSASGPQQCYVRPFGRYLFVNANNADAVNAVGATATISVAIYPGI